MRRFATITGLVAIGVLGAAAPALADPGWGSTDCSQVPSPACDLGAGTGGGNGSPGGHSGKGTPQPGDNGPGNGDGSGGSNGDTILGDSNLANCSYVRSDFQPPPGGAVTVMFGGSVKPLNLDGVAAQPAGGIREPGVALLAQQPAEGQPGAWYIWKCTAEGIADALYRPPVWVADGQAPDTFLPSPAELAQMARRQLLLPAPTIATSPAGDQLVNLPTWLWVSNGWGPISATASVPGVSVTAVATPTSVSWSMGDGSTVTCTGPGTSYRAGSDPRSSSPDCGHTYRGSSASQPGQAFPVSATVHWTVTWSGAGQGGTFPDMTTTGNVAFRVAESQALNNGGG
jgi:hypothetical protein